MIYHEIECIEKRKSERYCFKLVNEDNKIPLWSYVLYSNVVLATLLKGMKYFFLFLSCFPYQNSCHKGLRKRINVLIHLIYTK